MDFKQEIAKGLLSIEAVFLRPEEPFTWASGIKSPIYCDNRLTLTAPDVRTMVENGLAEVIRENYPQCEVLMGTSTAGNRARGDYRPSDGPSDGLCQRLRKGSRTHESNRRKSFCRAKRWSLSRI